MCYGRFCLCCLKHRLVNTYIRKETNKQNRVATKQIHVGSMNEAKIKYPQLLSLKSMVVKSTLLKCRTLTWRGGLRALVTLEAIPAGTAVPGRFNLAGQVNSR